MDEKKLSVGDSCGGGKVLPAPQGEMKQFSAIREKFDVAAFSTALGRVVIHKGRMHLITRFEAEPLPHGFFEIKMAMQEYIPEIILPYDSAASEIMEGFLEIVPEG